MNSQNKTAKSALLLILASSLLAWLFYVIALWSDIAITSGLTSEELYGQNSKQFVSPSSYLIFAALAVLAFGSLIAKKKILKSRSIFSIQTKLSQAVEYFASTIIIIALALSVLAAIAGFMSNFFSYGENEVAVIRIFDAYVPILLYTALVVFVLLAGFVFTKASTPNATVAKHATETPPPSATNVATSLLSEADTQQTNSAPNSQRSVGLAFTIPIVTVAIALILGLIVYDITRTSIEVWIWVIIQAIVATGIVLGTLYAVKSIRAQRAAGKPEGGAAVGSQVLNLVLSIVFAGVITLMSLGYSASAVEQLRLQHDLSLNVYSDLPTEYDGVSETMPITGAHIYASGSGLERGTTANVSLVADSGEVILVADSKTEGSGFMNIDADFPADLAVGDYVLTLEATDGDGIAQNLQLEVTVTADDRASFPNGANSYLSEDKITLKEVTVEWLFEDLLPALLLLVSVLGVLYFTIIIRNSEDDYGTDSYNGNTTTQTTTP